MTHFSLPSQVDVLVIGAGAAGLFCAIQAAKRGRSVWVIDHANKAGKKILMSGGGRCNFTNLDIEPQHFLSQNPHFVRSALSRYTQWDFIAEVAGAGIEYHEKSHGQLFCDHSAKDIQQLLLNQLTDAGGHLQLNTSIKNVSKNASGFTVETSKGLVTCQSLVVATGGLSIPTMGATAFGFEIAKQFGHDIVEYRASLVPFTWNTRDKEAWAELSGVSIPISATCQKGQSFTLDALITHRGLSGPAILQVSNYWQAGEPITINWLPQLDVKDALVTARQSDGKKTMKTWLSLHLPTRFAEHLCSLLPNKKLAELSGDDIQCWAQALNEAVFQPGGTEGYRTAEVTIGGVSTQEVSSKTFISQRAEGLYFIGEVLDVTGWLGGYNFQWAWSSGWAAGQYC